MTRFFLFTFVAGGWFFFGGVLFAEGKLKMLEPAGSVTEAEILKAMSSESKSSQLRNGYLENPTVLKCFAAMEYNDPEERRFQTPMRFRFHTPSKIEPGKKYPLIIWLHGQGESGDDNQAQLSHMQTTAWILAGKREIPCFILAPQSPEISQEEIPSSVANGEDLFLTITETIFQEILKEYPIDPRRVTLYGICSGGNAAYAYAARFPDRFAAVATCSASYSGDYSPFVKTTVWGFNNQDDGDGGKSLCLLTQYLNDHGGRGYVTLHPKGGHNSWTGSLRYGTVGWLTLQNQSRRSPPPNVQCRFHSKWKQFWLFELPLIILLGRFGFRKVRSFVQFRRDQSL